MKLSQNKICLKLREAPSILIKYSTTEDNANVIIRLECFLILVIATYRVFIYFRGVLRGVNKIRSFCCTVFYIQNEPHCNVYILVSKKQIRSVLYAFLKLHTENADS